MRAETTDGGDGGQHSQSSQSRNNNIDQHQQAKKIKARDCEINQTRNLSKQSEYQCKSVRHSSCQKSLENSARPHRLKTPIVIRKTEPKNIVRSEVIEGSEQKKKKFRTRVYITNEKYETNVRKHHFSHEPSSQLKHTDKGFEPISESDTV